MRILVGLSWWVDSAVAAYLLKKQWHEVIAWFMKNYAEPSNPQCHTREDRNMAIKVAQHLEIDTFIIFDFRQQYKDRIIDYIYQQYEKGVTPNPDVLCNSLIKFDLFLKKAKELGCHAIATGHYAGKEWHKLLRGKDRTKDQSYFLSQLSQEQLAHSLFPLGELTKKEIRKIAKDIGLPNAERPDSQWLCFIGDIPIANFLEKKLKNKEGKVIDTTGQVVWSHKGAYYYTLGQRHGYQTNKKHYIYKTDIAENTIHVSEDKEDPLLYTTNCEISDRHRINKEKKTPYNCEVKVRYRQKETIKATIEQTTEKKWKVIFSSPIRATAPGQFLVAYQGEEVIGSWIIAKTTSLAYNKTRKK